MTKIIKAKYKVSRRLKTSIWGNDKDPFHKKNYGPGQHGASTVGKISDYGLHLRAKQRLKGHYGRINERQFRNTFDIAAKMKGNTPENFIGLLESRIDSIIYRAGFAPTIFSARQMVSHCHFLLNGRKVNIASIKVKIGDVISVRPKSKDLTIFTAGQKSSPDYLKVDADKIEVVMLRKPGMSDVPYPFDPEMHLIVEFYSR